MSPVTWRPASLATRAVRGAGVFVLLVLALLVPCGADAAADGSAKASMCETCTTLFECGEGLRCVSARCRGADQCCLDSDCPGGQRCVDHQCRTAVSGAGLCGRCSTAFECANDLNCIGARCREAEQCCLDQDCPTGQSCQDHRCQ